VIFLPYSLLGPLHGYLMIPGESFDPPFVFDGAPGQSLLGDWIEPLHIAEEMDNVLRACQQRQVALNDNAIETVIYKSQQAAKQLVERFHRSSLIEIGRASCRERV